MTAPDVVELGRRVVKCHGFRWEPGMLDTHGRRAVDEREIPAWHDEGKSCEPYNASGAYEPRGDAVPVLTDPATLGALLGLVREAWGDPLWCPVVVWVDPDGELYDSRDAAGHREPFWVSMADLAAYYRAVRWRRTGEPMPPDLPRHASEVSLIVAALEAAPVRS